MAFAYPPPYPPPSGGLRLQLTKLAVARVAAPAAACRARPGAPRRGLWHPHVVCTAHPESNAFHFIVAGTCGHAAPRPKWFVFARLAAQQSCSRSDLELQVDSLGCHAVCLLLLVWKDFFARCAPPLAAAAPIDGDTSKQCIPVGIHGLLISSTLGYRKQQKDVRKGFHSQKIAKKGLGLIVDN